MNKKVENLRNLRELRFHWYSSIKCYKCFSGTEALTFVVSLTVVQKLIYFDEKGKQFYPVVPYI